jgi:hypothetical protein
MRSQAMAKEEGEKRMKEMRQSRKVRLMKKAERLIEEALDWEEKTDKPNLTQIEDIVLRLRQELGQEMAQSLLEAQEAKQPVPGPTCPKCGQEMRYKGQKEINPQSLVGQLEIERGYYHCPKCKESVFPPG